MDSNQCLAIILEYNTSFILITMYLYINYKYFTCLCLFLQKCWHISLFSFQVETKAVVQTFASPTFSSFLDMLLCSSVSLALSLACFLPPLVSQQSLSTPALLLTTGAALLEALALLFAIRWGAAHTRSLTADPASETKSENPTHLEFIITSQFGILI